MNSDKEKGKEKERGLRLSPPALLLSIKREGRHRPLPPPFTRDAEPRLKPHPLSPAALGPGPESLNELCTAGGAAPDPPANSGTKHPPPSLPVSLAPSRGHPILHAPAIPSSSSRARLPGPPPPAFQPQSILRLPPTPTRGPFENFVYLRLLSTSWAGPGHQRGCLRVSGISQCTGEATTEIPPLLYFFLTHERMLNITYH